MPYRPRDIYRGHRKYRVPLAIALFVLAFLLVSAVVLFYVLQQYIVYDQTGVTLQLPFMHRETQQQEAEAVVTAPAFEPVDVQVVYETPDFSDVDYDDWQALGETRARFIPYTEAVNEMSLNSAVVGAENSDFTGVVMELKPRSGQLAWASTCDTAVGYGTAGTMDYTDIVADLHEHGMTAAAQISCCVDELMAVRNWPATLQLVSGTPYRDGNGTAWLDPYNRTIRSYLVDLAGELAAMGFDEIILADLYHPVIDGEFLYSVTLQIPADPVMAVGQMGRRVVDALEGTDTVVSVRIDAESLRNGDGARTGQDIELFWRLFARLYCPTDEWNASTDVEYAVASMTKGDSAIRFVPVCGGVPQGFRSYVLTGVGTQG